jgi:hypothetical protein
LLLYDDATPSAVGRRGGRVASGEATGRREPETRAAAAPAGSGPSQVADTWCASRPQGRCPHLGHVSGQWQRRASRCPSVPAYAHVLVRSERGRLELTRRRGGVAGLPCPTHRDGRAGAATVVAVGGRVRWFVRASYVCPRWLRSPRGACAGPQERRGVRGLARCSSEVAARRAGDLLLAFVGGPVEFAVHYHSLD